MGFYGNITNTSKTQFQFDKTFPNRATMDQFIDTDGVYIGRYVLVEYDKELAADWTVTAYKKTIDGIIHFYSSASMEAETEIGYGSANIEKGKYIRIPGSYADIDGNWIVHNFDVPEATHEILYAIQEQGEDAPPIPINVILITERDPLENDYIINYNIDRRIYGGGRGYDSTVWQKVYADGIERYVMIAELNSVVPTFGVSADAPTMSPIAPHFDTDSTNVFYRVHWQPSWGLRVRAAAPKVYVRPTNEAGATVTGMEVMLSNPLEFSLPSDEKTTWRRAVYNTLSGELNKYYYDGYINEQTTFMHGEWVQSEEAPTKAGFPAAIYYNKDGFNPAIITYSDDKVSDKITIEPSGLSGTIYNNHLGKESTPQVDTQELSIMLPSIGDSIAKMWDLVYGDAEINNSKYRNMVIDWTEGSIIPNLSGLRLVSRNATGYGFNRRNVSTIAGAINSVHDLMGMIIREIPSLPKDVEQKSSIVESLTDDYIYYQADPGIYSRKQKQYKYIPLNAPEEEGGIPPEFTFDKHEFYSSNIMFDGDWTLPHNKFYLDYPTSNPIEENVQYPNVILESGVYHSDGRQYYSTAYLEEGPSTGPFTTENFGGTFKPYKFFELKDREITVNQNIKKIPSYQISLDTEYNNSKTYYAITRTSLGDNTRFWVEGEYLIGNFTLWEDHTFENFEKRELFEAIEIEGKIRYLRPSVYDQEGIYYSATFVTDSGNYDRNKQYFIADKKIQNNGTYVELIDYIPVPKEEVNEINFYHRNFYIASEDKSTYTLASVYDKDTQYYHKQVSLKPIESDTVSASDVNEVNVVLYEANRGYCKYYPAGEGGTNGMDEYMVLNESLIPTFASLNNLFQITLTVITNIYQPNLYYYMVSDEGDPLKGSIIFDTNSLPTEGRQYYTRYALKYGDPVTNIFYEPYKYYYYNEVLDEYVLETSEYPDPEKNENNLYCIKNGIYVINDPEGRFPKGMEWNLNVNPVPEGILVGTRDEYWDLAELYGFARHYTTIHGLILRLTNLLESKNTDIRDYDTAQGMLNKLKDILVNFGEPHNHEIMVTDRYGRITSTGLADDDWISATYSDNDENRKITVVHQYIGEDTGKGDHIVNGENKDRVLNYGDTFISPSFEFNTDDMGHVNSFSTSHKTLTMPTMEYIPDESGNVMIDLSMSAGSGANKITFTQSKVNVGTLDLAEYLMTAGETNVTKIAETDSINTAFAKINTAFNSLDYAMEENQNVYVSKVEETNGIIEVTTASTSTITALGIVTSGTWDSTIAKDRVTTLSILNSAVTTDKINNSAVTTEKINNLAVTTEKINDLAVVTGKIENSAVITEKIADGNVTNAKLASTGLDISKFTVGTLIMDRVAPESITTDKIVDGGITEAKLANLAVTTGKIAEGAITTNKINSSAITTDLINNSAVTLDKIATNAISTDKIIDSAVTSSKIASLEASKITGTLSTDNIPSLNMNKITEGNLVGSRVVLTGYSASSLGGQSVSANDTANEAIAKLEKRIVDLEEQVKALEEANTTV